MERNLSKLESRKIGSVQDARNFISDFDEKYKNIFDNKARKHIEQHHVSAFSRDCPGKSHHYFMSLFGLAFFSPMIYMIYYSISENSSDRFGLLIFILVFAAIWEFLALKPILDFRPGRQALVQCLRQTNVRSGELESLFRAYKKIDDNRPRGGPGGGGGC